MDTNLLLGITSCLIASITIGYRFGVPGAKEKMQGGFGGTVDQSWFTVITLGFLPLAAGMLFLAAWWQGPESASDRTATTQTVPVDRSSATLVPR